MYAPRTGLGKDKMWHCPAEAFRVFVPVSLERRPCGSATVGSGLGERKVRSRWWRADTRFLVRCAGLCAAALFLPRRVPHSGAIGDASTTQLPALALIELDLGYGLGADVPCGALLGAGGRAREARAPGR